MATAFLILYRPSFAEALLVGFDVPAIDVAQGDGFSIDLMVSGLNGTSLPSLGSFDVDILYDTSQMTFENYSLGTGLGEVNFFEAEDISLGNLGGVINLAVVSWLFDFELELQPAEFSLATLSFRCLAPGISTIGIDADDPYLYFGDEWGFQLPVDIGEGVLVTQSAGAAPVPEPSTMLLFGIGLAGFVGNHRRKRKRVFDSNTNCDTFAKSHSATNGA